jgi:hypothetical protein
LFHKPVIEEPVTFALMSSNVPAILGALVADGLSAIGVPGGSTAGEAVKGYLNRRSAMATDVLLDEFRRAEIDAATAVAEDDRVAIIYRYLRASWEGSARVNLRLLAKAIVGRMQANSLVADDFMPHADALAALSRDEIILLAEMYRVQQSFGRTGANKEYPWIAEVVPNMERLGWSKDRANTTAGRALRSGYVIAVSGFGALVFVPSPLLIDLCKTVDFDDALRREANK